MGKRIGRNDCTVGEDSEIERLSDSFESSIVEFDSRIALPVRTVTFPMATLLLSQSVFTMMVPVSYRL